MNSWVRHESKGRLIGRGRFHLQISAPGQRLWVCGACSVVALCGTRGLHPVAVGGVTHTGRHTWQSHFTEMNWACVGLVNSHHLGHSLEAIVQVKPGTFGLAAGSVMKVLEQVWRSEFRSPETCRHAGWVRWLACNSHLRGQRKESQEVLAVVARL